MNDNPNFMLMLLLSTLACVCIVYLEPVPILLECAEVFLPSIGTVIDRLKMKETLGRFTCPSFSSARVRLFFTCESE